MPTQTRRVKPGPDARSVRTAEGAILHPPADWALLPPGDAGLTRRVKAGGPTWTVEEKVGRKLFSRGVWAPAARIEAARAAVEAERGDPAYARRLTAGRVRRAKQEVAYVEDFRQAVLDFLAFAPAHRALAERLAEAVATHATPVGSGTVARTKRIPIEERAESAVIAWLRHQTTTYDDLVIPRVKGARREVRRELAARSRRLLQQYRPGALTPADPSACPLQRALAKGRGGNEAPLPTFHEEC